MGAICGSGRVGPRDQRRAYREGQDSEPDVLPDLVELRRLKRKAGAPSGAGAEATGSRRVDWDHDEHW